MRKIYKHLQNAKGAQILQTQKSRHKPGSQSGADKKRPDDDAEISDTSLALVKLFLIGRHGKSSPVKPMMRLLLLPPPS
jgi:hypothetical protein